MSKILDAACIITWCLKKEQILWHSRPARRPWHSSSSWKSSITKNDQSWDCHVNYRLPTTSRSLGVRCLATKTTRTSSWPLPPPSIVYSDNHILVVNKPPGWHVVPNSNNNQHHENDSQGENHNNHDDKTKCLLTYLQEQQWGGGSQHNFLKPINRIDQPCSGITMFAKTTKAASRITTVWKQRQVTKSYFCWVAWHNVDHLQRNSVPTARNRGGNESRGATDTSDLKTIAEPTAEIDNDDDWWKIEGYLHRRKSRPGSKRDKNSPVGWSVILSKEEPHKPHKSRLVQAYWRLLDLPSSTLSQNKPSNQHQLLEVQSHDGARHVIRGLLAQIGACPILGDTRYGGGRGGASNNNPLGDFSVGLHARSIRLPDHLQLGTTDQRYFEAPIPTSWATLLQPLITENMRDET